MNLTSKHGFKPCVTGAFGGGLSRTAYYDGMVLSEADMLREQAYWRTKRKLTNRALGDGVVWGLTLHWDARARQFALGPGYGLACCGDDLVVECAQCIPEAELVDPCSEEFRRLLVHASHGLDPAAPRPRVDGPVQACVLLEYVECPEDPRAVFEDACAQQPDGCRFGAMRETTRLRLVPPPEPPPSGPIERFSAQIEELRAGLAGLPDALVEPLFALQPQRARAGLAFVDAAGVVLDERDAALEFAANATANATLATPAVAPAAVRLGLEPPPGHVFTAARIGTQDLAAAEVLMGVFRTLTPPPAVATDLDVTLEVMPLFGSEAGSGVDLRLHFDPRPGGAGPLLTARVTALRPLPPRGDCGTLLADGLLSAGNSGDSGATLRTLALAVLCGWFKGGLLNAGCTPPVDGETATPAAQARWLLAWMICRMAWRALFGIDIRAAAASGFETCLQRLFKAWCEGFHYKGPRCDGEPHGIVLGSVQLSTKGRVLCFDAWAHRRHVLTGPLLTHWGGQFGLAPLDASIARLARWVCCVAAAPMPARPDGVTLPATSVLPLAGGAIAAGTAFTASDKLGNTPIREVRQVGTLDFIGRVIGALFDPDAPSLGSASALRAVTAPGGSLQWLEPTNFGSAPAGTSSAPAAAAEALLAEVNPAARTLSATVRLPMRDLVARYAAAVPLAQLKARAGVPLFEPMVSALESGGIVTLGDLVRSGPEPALAQLRAATPQHEVLADPRAAEKAIALVYDSALKALAGVADTVAERARTADELEPFTRSDLDDAAVLAGLRKLNQSQLRRPAPELMKRVVAEAAAAPPR